MQSDEAVPDRFEIKVLDPASVRLFHAPVDDARVRLEMDSDVVYIEARIACALPLSNPDQYLTLRDGADKEIGVIIDWRNLDPASLAIARDALGRNHFLPKVLKVYEVRERRVVVVWDVETDRGRRRFTVGNIRDNAVSLSEGRVLMTDVEGNRYDFHDVALYDVKSREVLQKVL